MENLCYTCPRKCGVNRAKTTGFCKVNEDIQIAKIMIHHFEEPIISGECETDKRGSGAIFFVGCSLGCVYCQNSNISGGGSKITETGKKVSPTELAEIFKRLETQGAYNINLVTPTHFTGKIVEALKIYKPKVPVVWNSSGYELAETLKKLEGLVDIFLVDFKYYSSENAAKYSFAPNYPEVCEAAILEMKRQQKEDVIENGLMKKGIIVRHLVLPTLTKDSEGVIDFVAKNLGTKTYFSLMSQYVPCGNAKNHPEIDRKISPLEYKILYNKLIKLGFENAFVQDHSSAKSVFTPNFEVFDDGTD